MTDDEIKAARALCEAATPGEWHCYHHEGYGWRIDAAVVGIIYGEWNEADGDLIAASRALVPRLLDEVERLRSALAERDGRIEALEDALNRAAIVLESRSDKMFRDDCARDARRVLKSKVAP